MLAGNGLDAGAQGQTQEAGRLDVGLAGRAFGDIERDGRRRPPDLGFQVIVLLAWNPVGDISGVVFKDINPSAPVHLLIVPRKHIRSINDLTTQDHEILSEMIMTGKDMAVKTSVSQSGYKLLFNVERGGGQIIFHLHLHLSGGWK